MCSQPHAVFPEDREARKVQRIDVPGLLCIYLSTSVSLCGEERLESSSATLMPSRDELMWEKRQRIMEGLRDKTSLSIGGGGGSLCVSWPLRCAPLVA